MAISVDPPAVSDKLAAAHGLTFPIAADEDGAVIKAFGVWDPENEIAWPSIFVVGKDGKVAWRWLADIYKERVPTADVLSAIPSP